MLFEPRLRRLLLAVHVLVSVSFPGAVAAFLVLAVIGLGGDLSAYRAMDTINTAVVVPLCLLALLSGIVSSLGTPWGLVRHWWVLVKLALTLPSTAILLVHSQPIARMAGAARLTEATMDTQFQLVAAAGAAVGILVFMTALSVYKPRGLTPFAP